VKTGRTPKTPKHPNTAVSRHFGPRKLRTHRYWCRSVLRTLRH